MYRWSLSGEWVITILIAVIPIVGFIMLIVWAFGSGTNPNKANWAKAGLIWYLVFIGFHVLIFVFWGATAFFNM